MIQDLTPAENAEFEDMERRGYSTLSEEERERYISFLAQYRLYSITFNLVHMLGNHGDPYNTGL